MNILALDSSAVSASAALVNENKIIGEFYCNTGLTHSQTLVPMTDALLKNTKTSISDVDVFAVCVGPGSFTGVRIGVAAVKGMAAALDKPCIAVSTLEAMAMNMLGRPSLVCAVMDARCSQVYNALFRINGETVERICDDRALSITDLATELSGINEDIVLVGDGAELCMKQMDIPSIRLAAMNLRFQRASGVAMAALRIKPEEYLSAVQLMPHYLRLPQAERELRKKQNLK